MIPRSPFFLLSANSCLPQISAGGLGEELIFDYMATALRLDQSQVNISTLSDMKSRCPFHHSFHHDDPNEKGGKSNLNGKAGAKCFQSINACFMLDP